MHPADESSSRRRAPSPPALRVGRRLRQEPLVTLMEAARLGDVTLLRSSSGPLYLLRHPDHIKQVLQDRQANYSKQTQPYQRLRVAFGSGLLTSEGAEWLLRRRMAQPGFHLKVVEGYAQLMLHEACRMVERLRVHFSAGKAVDISAELTRTTFSVLCRTLLGSEPEPLFDAVRDFCEVLNERTSAWVTLPGWIPTASNRRMRSVLSVLEEKVQGLITRARASSEPRGDLLSLLVHASEADTGVRMTDQQLRDEVMTLFVAGHESSAAALSWTFYLLASHPEVDERLRAELDAVLGDRLPGVEDVSRLVYTRMVLNEAMRLYPPAWSLSRRALAEDVIGGYRIPRGAILLVSPWVTHRLPDFWERPDEFLPERFAPSNASARPRFAYFPFLGGPRQCIGAPFANLEALLLLATVVPRVRYRLFPLLEVRPHASVVLRPWVGPYLLMQGS